MKRIGVFACHCGVNISATVDIKEVVEFAKSLPYVVSASDYTYMCSDPGQQLIQTRIKEFELNRVVVASCSPTMHGITFREVVKKAGVNPYCFEMANIREQCSWVHLDRKSGTEKAKAIIAAAVGKVSLFEPLEEKTVSVTPSVLIIGAGIAGIQASLDIANAGYSVHLVEKEPSVGGRMAQLDKTFPTLDCSACILTPKMSEVGHHENIELHTYSEVLDVSGYVGNFTVTLKKKPRYIDEVKCTGCGDCTTACPVIYEPRPKIDIAVPEIKDEERRSIVSILEKYAYRKKNLIQILQDINLEFRFLPQNILKFLSMKMNVALSHIYNVVTFYSAFSLTPHGEHTIKVCMGTACYARGAANVLEEIERKLEIRDGETTFDLRFTLETVNCLGCCAIGPVVKVDDEYFTVTPDKVNNILRKYEKDN